jgi:cytochrome c biogenesis protein CcmG, thiol:disulfide interchange protein DsbE
MPLARRAPGWLLAALLLCPVAAWGGAGRTVSSLGVRSGDRPPPFSVTDVTGKVHSLDEYRDQVLVLHFWASWCPYCRTEIDELRELHHRWSERGVRVLAVSVDQDPRAFRRFLASVKLPYPVVLDPDTSPSMAERYRISGIPVTVVIGSDGVIAERIEGAGDILRAAERALAAPRAT